MRDDSSNECPFVKFVPYVIFEVQEAAFKFTSIEILLLAGYEFFKFGDLTPDEVLMRLRVG